LVIMELAVRELTVVAVPLSTVADRVLALRVLTPMVLPLKVLVVRLLVIMVLPVSRLVEILLDHTGALLVLVIWMYPVGTGPDPLTAILLIRVR
jgi:hypothetical protein